MDHREIAAPLASDTRSEVDGPRRWPGPGTAAHEEFEKMLADECGTIQRGLD